MSASPRGYPVRCIAHVHSTHSDGTATVRELRAAGRRAGAQVLLLTDHDSLGARDAGEDGWGDGVLVVVSAGTAKPVAVETALERLSFVHANLLGIVLNQSGQDLEATGGYYYTSPESTTAV